MEQSWIGDAFRSIFAGLDGVVYDLIATVYNLLLEIAQFKVFSSTDIEQISSRIYTILGIFMLFKLSFSLINYLINPDALTDKQKGIQHIVKNIVIMFAMLIMCPWVFEKMWDLQSVILRENFIGSLVFGNTSTTTNNDNFIYSYQMGLGCSEASEAKSAGDYIGIMVLKGFYRPYTLDELGENGQAVVSDGEYKKVNEEYLCKKVNKGRPSYYLTSSIYNAYSRTSGILWWANDIYVMNYRIVLSTAIGVVVLLILVGFCMDVGLRLVKLSFLEIVAPIPIISYIDPSSGKDGIFKKWTREVIGTWTNVFIRLLALFFATSVIQKVDKLQWIGQGENTASIWVIIFVIIGSLMFAKQLPSLIEKIFGIKLEGGFSVNPLKKMEKQALGGKFLSQLPGKTLAAATGLATTAAGRAHANFQQKMKAEELERAKRQNAMRRDRLNELNAQRNSQQTRANLLRSRANDLANAEAKRQEIENKLAQVRAHEVERRRANNGQLTDAERQSIATVRLKLNNDLKQVDAIINNVTQNGRVTGDQLNNRLNDAQSQIDSLSQYAKRYEKNIASAEEDIKKQTAESDKFSNNHAFTASLLQAFRGAKIGFDAKDTQGLVSAITAGIEASKKAAKITIDHDKMGFVDRVKDSWTDISGIKNESGTTSMTKKAIKELTETLNDLTNGVSSLEHALGNLNPGAITYDSQGKIQINNTGTYTYAPGERESIEHLIRQYEQLRKSQKSVSKEIKEYEEILATKGDKK